MLSSFWKSYQFARNPKNFPTLFVSIYVWCIYISVKENWGNLISEHTNIKRRGVHKENKIPWPLIIIPQYLEIPRNKSIKKYYFCSLLLEMIHPVVTSCKYIPCRLWSIIHLYAIYFLNLYKTCLITTIKFFTLTRISEEDNKTKPTIIHSTMFKFANLFTSKRNSSKFLCKTLFYWLQYLG